MNTGTSLRSYRSFPISAEILSDLDQGDDAEDLTAFISGATALDSLTSLVDKNLLKQVEGPEGEPRFVMLETIREFAWAQLAEQGDLPVLQRRHASYYLALAEASVSHLRSVNQMAWATRLEFDHDNFRAALTWAAGRGTAGWPDAGDAEVGLRLAGALFWFWHFRNYLGEGRRWLDAVLLQPRESNRTAPAAMALLGFGILAVTQGDHTTAPARLEESVAIWRELGDKRGLALARGPCLWYAA